MRGDSTRTLLLMSSGAPTLALCPICEGEHLVYQFTHATTPIVRCGRCGIVMRNPQPSDSELAAIYTEKYFLVPGAEADRLKRETAAGYLDEIEARLGRQRPDKRSRPQLLEVGSGLGNLLLEARDRGYDVTGVEYSASQVRAANERLGAECVRQGTIGYRRSA